MILFAVLPGCGRIHFDPLADASDGIDAAPRCSAQAPFTTITRVDSLSSSMIDGAARLDENETTAYFHSDRTGGLFQIWSATRASRDMPFEMPTIAVTSSAFWPTLTNDALTLVYSTNDLLMSTRGNESETFPPATVIASLDSVSALTNPFLGPLGTTLYFTIYEPEGSFYSAPWPPTGGAQPIAELNTAGREEAPVLSADERVIYFARDTGTGPDVFMAQRDSPTSSFGPELAVTEVNSASDDKPTSLSPDLCRLYFETSRDGFSDIYLAERTP
jgi:hypothetical protein